MSNHSCFSEYTAASVLSNHSSYTAGREGLCHVEDSLLSRQRLQAAPTGPNGSSPSFELLRPAPTGCYNSRPARAEKVTSVLSSRSCSAPTCGQRALALSPGATGLRQCCRPLPERDGKRLPPRPKKGVVLKGWLGLFMFGDSSWRFRDLCRGHWARASEICHISCLCSNLCCLRFDIDGRDLACA